MVTIIMKILPDTRGTLVTIPDDAPLIEAAKLLRGEVDIVVVCDPAGSLAGVITKRDVVRQISVCQGAGCMTRAALVMTRDVTTCRAEDWLHDVWSVMKQRGLKNVPVVDPGSRPIGILNARVALQALLQETENEEMLLRDYVMGVGYH
jgi:CBS domain-containing protein